jgi:hypothetical protein
MSREDVVVTRVVPGTKGAEDETAKTTFPDTKELD